ncbi:MAG: gamma-glutamyltransferase, partial [Rhodospirillales bacterium]|nr:gamma-glutamyltransferase [Rhodospirillales bacterium]
LDPADYPLAGGTAGDLFGWPKVKDDRNLVGAMAAAAPTVALGMHKAHGLFGRTAWPELVSPAIPLAAEGPAVDWHMLIEIATAYAHLSRDPGCRAAFLPGNAPPIPPAAVAPEPVLRLPNAALARTLAAIASDGPDALYKRTIGRALCADFKDAGGCVSEADLVACEARVREAASVRHGAYRVDVVPELSGGPTMIRAFEGLARRGVNPRSGKPLDAQTFVAIAAALNDAWNNRFDTMGDTPTTAITSTTTHISVVDRDGNMVSLTQTLLSLFGSRFLSPSTGILLNNAINWFDPRPGTPNSIGPGKRALCNYCPAIMVGDDQAVAIGGSGGRKIMPAVFQLLVMLANGLSLDKAFHAPRIDVSGGERVVVDRDLPDDVQAALAAQFQTLRVERTAYPAQKENAESQDYVEGPKAFAEKRKPNWQNK